MGGSTAGVQHGAAWGLVRAVFVGFVGAAMAIALSSVVGAQGTDDYPDLVADPPENVQPPAEIGWAGETFLAVKFDGFVTNLGGGPLHVQGNPQPSAFGTPGAVAQFILDGSGSTVATYPLQTTGSSPEVQYENSDDHEHWHFMRIMEYSLWDQTKTTQVTAGSKIGFCLYDIERVSGSEPGVYNGGGNWCAGNGYPGGGPGATYLEMGVTEGWRDTYNRFINLQWVDVSDVAPGVYYLGALADPTDAVQESDETNNSHTWAGTQTIIPGYLATDVGPVASSGPTAVTLGADSFGSSLGTRTFVITQGPAHGTLSVDAGTPFTSPSITYTPTNGYDGTDTFTYYAYDQGSDYPQNRSAHSATVSLNVATPNQQPTLASIADQSSPLGATVALQLAGTDPDTADTLTYTATGLPSGLSIDAASGLISGTADTLGTSAVVARVSDGVANASRSFTWTVTEAPTFGDVPDDHRFVDAISWMAAEGISLGCGNGDYCPDDPVTRGQIASFFVRAFGLTNGAGANLFDDDNGNTHETNIDILATAEITLGCAERQFCPNNDVTRGQFASLLVRAAGLSGGENADRFVDDDGNTHETNIDILAHNDVTQGCTATTFCPEGTLTRGQLAQLLFRTLGD